MIKNFAYKTETASVALELDGYYVWDCSVIKAEGKYYLFASRWKEEFGFGWNWLFNSEVIQCVAELGGDQPRRVRLRSAGSDRR